jgi:hypothetical protein
MTYLDRMILFILGVFVPLRCLSFEAHSSFWPLLEPIRTLLSRTPLVAQLSAVSNAVLWGNGEVEVLCDQWRSGESSFESLVLHRQFDPEVPKRGFRPRQPSRNNARPCHNAPSQLERQK